MGDPLPHRAGTWASASIWHSWAGTHTLARSEIHHIRRRAVMEDEGQAAILALTVAAALVSLAAIFAHLGTGAGGGGGPHVGSLVFVALTIGASCTFIHTMFALHYAHEFYSEEQRGRAGSSRARSGSPTTGTSCTSCS